MWAVLGEVELRLIPTESVFFMLVFEHFWQLDS